MSPLVNSASQDIVAAAAPVVQRIKDHPFLAGLCDGSLPKKAFQRFIVQDWLFLDPFGRALAAYAARAQDADEVALFCHGAARVLEIERASHAEMAGRLGVESQALAEALPTPTCFAYGNFVKYACSSGERGDAMGALLPCIWIYGEVGRELSEVGSSDPLYADWMNQYTEDEYVALWRAAEQACDAVGTELGPAAHASMLAHAHGAARYEWMFWDSAYRSEQWPM